eukprot:jgi/Mesvir1/26655/Mv20444-RA.1
MAENPQYLGVFGLHVCQVDPCVCSALLWHVHAFVISMVAEESKGSEKTKLIGKGVVGRDSNSQASDRAGTELRIQVKSAETAAADGRNGKVAEAPATPTNEEDGSSTLPASAGLYSVMSNEIEVPMGLMDVTDRMTALHVGWLNKRLGFNIVRFAPQFVVQYKSRCPDMDTHFEDEHAFLNTIAALMFESHSSVRSIVERSKINWLVADNMMDAEFKANLFQGTGAATGNGAVGAGGSVPLMDDLVFSHFPISAAAEEALGAIQAEVQANLSSGALLASVPCGRMRELLTLDLSRAQNVRLAGIDCDPSAVEAARQLLKEQRFVKGSVAVEFVVREAEGGSRSKMDVPGGPYDVVTSICLNRLLDERALPTIFRNAHSALKPGGVFVTAQVVDPHEWRMENLTPFYVNMQRVTLEIVADIYLLYPERTCEAIIKQLKDVGFTDVKEIPSLTRVLPVFVAKKGLEGHPRDG